ncbi:secreted RxLR effector protein 161-like [Mercurialis annua]|uniref:secreted RxLR effector protein 161-like n=1 Tax=Mercurialis annua TaxID=3986 RepID=UPI00215E5EB7|nr:secreted RxLR effector protein 161-like [Mercurialis annua]
MDKANPLSTPMVVETDQFCLCEENKDILGPEVPYLSAIGALMYLGNCTRPDISFSVNLLARFSLAPTKRHWNRIKHIFRYFCGSTDLNLFYSNDTKIELIGYADASYFSDPLKIRSQTGYIFTSKGIAISWRSQKQTIVATSLNQSELFALHEANREFHKSPTVICEDNAACIAQIKEGYVKSDRTKHIPPRFFSYTQELIKNQKIDIQYVQSNNNSSDLFTKLLPTAIFRKHVHNIGI